MSESDSTALTLENARVVVPCRLCGNPMAADNGKIICPDCQSKKYAAYSRNRRAKKIGNGGVHTAADIKAQYDRQRGKCFYCGRDVGDNYHVDHVVPLALGGSNGPENLVIACPECNGKKRAKHPMDFCGRLF